MMQERKNTNTPSKESVLKTTPRRGRAWRGDRRLIIGRNSRKTTSPTSKNTITHESVRNATQQFLDNGGEIKKLDDANCSDPVVWRPLIVRQEAIDEIKNDEHQNRYFTVQRD